MPFSNDINQAFALCVPILDVDHVLLKRVFKAPFKEVLEVTKRLGMFDLTEEEIHNNVTIPRFHTYAEIMGVKFHVSEWNEDGIIEVTLVD